MIRKLFPLVLIIFLACVPSQQKSREWLNKGLEKFYTSKFEESITLFDNAIDKNPNNYEAFYYRGNAKFNIKDIKGALSDLTQAISIKPSYADAYDARGNVYTYLGKKDEACKDYQKAESLGKPDMSDKTRGCR